MQTGKRWCSACVQTLQEQLQPLSCGIATSLPEIANLQVSSSAGKLLEGFHGAQSLLNLQTQGKRARCCSANLCCDRCQSLSVTIVKLRAWQLVLAAKQSLCRAFPAAMPASGVMDQIVTPATTAPATAALAWQLQHQQELQHQQLTSLLPASSYGAVAPLAGPPGFYAAAKPHLRFAPAIC